MKRLVRKSIGTSALRSERLAALDHREERVFWRLLLATDSYGSLELTDLRGVRLDAFADIRGLGTSDDIEAALAQLVDAKLVEVWVEDTDGPHRRGEPQWDAGTRWVHVIDHDRHQAPKFLADRAPKRPSPVPPSKRRSAPNSTDPAPARQRSAPNGAGTVPHGEPNRTNFLAREEGGRKKEEGEETGRTREAVGEGPADDEVIAKAIATLVEASVDGTTPDDFASNVEMYRWLNRTATPELILRAAMRCLTRSKDTGRPFTVSSAWKFVEGEVVRIQRQPDPAGPGGGSGGGGGKGRGWVEPGSPEWIERSAAALGPLPTENVA